ncbi:MAG: M1 family metallopeptidase [Flammeovirgaceae bacterium]
MAVAQPDRWQQKAIYTMEVDLDVKTHKFTGKQKLEYTNNSPDELKKVFYHLYFNAFQPNSEMDIRSRTIEDPDRRVGSRIFYLKENEIGIQKVKSLKMNGKDVKFEHAETILEVTLNESIKPKTTAIFEMEFEGQVPLQIRRSGRDNAEGIAYSMAQWYPKMAEYDYQGWHANPYIGREFYGVWGDFDVKITLDASYVVASTGYLQNPKEVGHGYYGKEKGKPNKDGKLTWHFKAPNVHDFTWAADPDYKHVIAQVPDGPEVHFFYQENQQTATWEKLPEYTVKAIQLMSKYFGKYPYNVYNVVQGGDGGMEYAMLTLITGHRNIESLVGVMTHELAHSWFQMVLGTNESLYAWMDEGFTEYATNKVTSELFGQQGDPQLESYPTYFNLAKSGKEEPLTTHADHFKSNYAYSMAAYGKGAVFLHQLSYIIGQENLDKTMLAYFDTWKFKHPNCLDFIRIAEKISGLELDWYIEYFVFTTKQIDYGIRNVISVDNNTYITFEKIGDMIMPLDFRVEFVDGAMQDYYIPLALLRGEKPQENKDIKREILPDWRWVIPTYTVSLPYSGAKIRRIIIDPTSRMADIDPSNNVFDASTFIIPK